jgi:hypothetical protein
MLITYCSCYLLATVGDYYGYYYYGYCKYIIIDKARTKISLNLYKYTM